MNALVAQYGLLAGSGLMAGAVSFAAWTIMRIVTHPKTQLNRGDRFEIQRLEQVRAGNSVFRWFEPIVNELSGLYDSHSERMRQLRRRF